MATKRIETQLSITAVDKYTSVLRNMQTVTGRFATGVRTELSRLQDLRGPLRLIEDFQAAKRKVAETSAALAAARDRLRRAQGALSGGGTVTAQMRREFETARRGVERLEDVHERHRRNLGQLRGALREAGVNTSNLAGEQRRLATELGGATTAFGRYVDKMKRVDEMQKRIAEGRERMDRSLGTAANLSFVGGASTETGRRVMTALSGPVGQAMSFETAMSDVRKVVDFETPKAFAEMSEEILTLSTRIPMAAEGLAQIVAAGGQSGLKADELLTFAEKAAKVGVAFDVSADTAGTSMAKIKTALGLTLDETSLLFDAMNHLSNNMASEAPQVLDFSTRVAVDGEVKGFSATETMAFGSAMIAAGANADVAATSFRNMGKALARGESVTPRQRAAYEALGLDAAAAAKRMQEDAVATTLDVMERINTLPKHLQSSLISDLFGDEARALAPLINDLDLLRESLGLVAEEQSYAGSADREYAERAKTTANNLQLMRNQMTRLGVSVGSVVLPQLNELLKVSRRIVDRMVAWTKENPKLTKTLFVGATALGAMAVAGGVVLTAAAGLIGTMAVLRFGLVGLGARAAFASGNLLGVGTAFRGLSRLPKFGLSRLVKPLVWTARLIPGIGWASLAGGLRWSALIKPLLWAGRGALRFIPIIGWASLAGELAWHLLIKPLGWDKYLNLEALRSYIDKIRSWFSWDFIKPLDLSKYIKWPEIPAGLKRIFNGEARREDTPVGSGFGPAGARASGGPVQAGLPYLVNENTPRSEWFVPSRSGGILNVSQAQAAVRTHLSSVMPRPRVRPPGFVGLSGGAQGLRAASLAAIAGSVIAAPAAAAPERAAASTVNVQIESVSVQVPSGVSDPGVIADLVADRIGQRVSATISASFSD
ncbi:phage tail tape measure protein [Palleronia caenipelagi]|uniref:Phage tail tape measure protein n=1 Tax=Palleronia caenipelagi TaxID=2489174 RepID=A0A547PS49_9RHOB|nr:phage tail tape measure protein [Palleronia caenipelagi]TRD16977.1 phage tail tape measure protein [Palleronia caenipelagi]